MVARGSCNRPVKAKATTIPRQTVPFGCDEGLDRFNK
jgi:hypothetical protein